MTESELTEKDWNGHFAFMHLKEFKNHKEIYLNGKPLKWWNRFKNGDVIEVIDKPHILTTLSFLATVALFVTAHPFIALGLVVGLVGAVSTAITATNRAVPTSTQNKEYSSVTQPELRGASNDISSDIIPVTFGVAQQTPSYAQTPYRLVGDGNGENKYKQYFIPNYNNVSYSDFKLGETPITNYLPTYYSIDTASASSEFIGFENCKAISIDEELSYDKEGEVSESYTEYLNQTVSATSEDITYTLRFENVPSNLGYFSNKSFTIEITGLNGIQEVQQASNITLWYGNLVQSGNNYIYSGNVSFTQTLTELKELKIYASSNTHNNIYETESDLTIYVQNSSISAGTYSQSFAPDAKVNLYTGIPSEVIQTSPLRTTEIDVILGFNQGLYKINASNGARYTRSVSVDITYKKIDETEWHNIGDADSLYIRDLNGVKQPLSSSNTTVSGKKVTVYSPTDVNVADQLFFRPIGFEVEEGQYNVRVRSAEYSDKTNYDVGVAQCSEIQFRCNGDVVNPLVLATTNQVAFEVTAYKNLSGTLKKFNYIAHTSIPVWNGTDWNTMAVSSNPAAVIRYLLTDERVNPRAESVSHIDNDSLVEYYEWCEESGYKADGVISEACKIGEVINQILINSQCAMIPLYNGKHTFVIDKPNKIPVGLFNQHNSWNFKWTPNIGRQTEAIRASFVENDDWTEDELTLYWYDGGVYDEPKAGTTDSDYEMVKKEYKYVYDRASVRQIVAYELETIQTKRNQFEFDVNLEAMNMMLLDRVYISNTANMQNESTGLIKDVITDNGNITGFELYADVDIPENAKIVIRSLDYDNEKAVINTYDVTNSGTNYIINIEPVPYNGIIKGAGEITGIQDSWHYDGDLFTLGQDTIYDCTVTDIKYNDDGTATITARDYGFGVNI